MDMKPIIWVTILVMLATDSESACEPVVNCIGEDKFSINITIFNQVFDAGIILHCPERHICVTNSNTPCQLNNATTTIITEETEIPTTPTPPTSTTTATTTTIGPPTCTAEGYFRANKCNQYYECVRALWWYNVELKTCRAGNYFSTKNPPCSSPANAVCTD